MKSYHRMVMPGRRAAALGLLVALFLCLYITAVAPLVGHLTAERTAVAELRTALARYRESTPNLPALSAELAALRSQAPARSTFLPGKSETIASAGLQARVKTAVTRAGGSMRSIEVLPSEKHGKQGKVALRTRVEIGLSGLQHLLHSLEETTPRLTFDSLDARLANAGPGGGRRDADPRLTVTFNIHGYLWHEE